MIVKLDASEVLRAYSGVLSKLSELTGFDQKAVLRGEAGIIIKTAAGKTKVANPAEVLIRARAMAARSSGVRRASTWNTTVNTGRRGGEVGRVWFRTKNRKYQVAGQIVRDSKFTPTWMHWTSSDWSLIKEATAKYTEALRTHIPQSKQSAGLGRQSWLQAADAIGIDLATVKGGGNLSAAGIAKARAAIASNGMSYQNGSGYTEGDGVKSAVTFINRLPYGAKAATTEGRGFEPMLLRIVAGRVNYFEQSYAKGAFDSLANTARAYPWVRVTIPGLSLEAA